MQLYFNVPCLHGLHPTFRGFHTFVSKTMLEIQNAIFVIMVPINTVQLLFSLAFKWKIVSVLSRFSACEQALIGAAV